MCDCKNQRTSKEVSAGSDASYFPLVLQGISIFQHAMLIEESDLFCSTALRNHIVLPSFHIHRFKKALLPSGSCSVSLFCKSVVINDNKKEIIT